MHRNPLLTLSTLLLFGSYALGQTVPSVTQDAKDSHCSNIVALAGSVSLDCSSLTKEQQKLIASIPGLLHKIIAKQLDPQLVMEKLDEIIANQQRQSDEIDKIKGQSWRLLTEHEVSDMSSVLSSYAGTKVRIEIPNPAGDDRNAIAQQLAKLLREAKWNVLSVDQTMEFFTTSGGQFPHGILIYAKAPNETASAIGNLLWLIYGSANVHGVADQKVEEDVKIKIWPPLH